MKFNQLKKYLIKLSIACAVILAMFGTIYYFVSDYADDLDQQIGQLKDKTSSADSQYKQLQKQVDDAKEALDYYKNFNVSESSKSENFRRDFAKELLVKLKDDNNISELKFNMEQFQKLTGEYERENVAIFESKVTAQFSGNSDVDVFNLIKNITETFPGNVCLESFKITRNRNMDDSLFVQIGQGRAPGAIVGGEIIFTWQGIQDNPDYTGKKVVRPGTLPAGAPIPGDHHAGAPLPPNAVNPNE